MVTAPLARPPVLARASSACARDWRALGAVAPEAGRLGGTAHHDRRRTGQAHQVVVGYFPDADNLVILAMNGWGLAEPAWWLDLQSHPEATVQSKDGVRSLHARLAQGAERGRLWSRWGEIDKNLDAFAARRPTETAVVVLEPRDGAAPAADAVKGAAARA
jgi:deazaflavin-dependent oxidoreductase (nitroreductase family)